MKLTPEQVRDVAIFHEAAESLAKQNDFSCHVVARLQSGGSVFSPLRRRYENAFNRFDHNVFKTRKERALACLFAAEMVKTGDL